MNTIQQRDYQKTDETHRNDFVIAVSPFIDEYGLDPMEYRLYSHIVRRAGKEGCFESIPNMAKICLMNEKTVRKTLRVLIAAGLIQIAQQRQGKTTIYQITHSSEWVYSEQLKSIRQRFNAHKVEQNLLGQNLTPTKLGTTNHDTPTKSGRGSSTKLGTGSSTKSGRGVVPNLVDEVFPIKEIPIKQSNPPTPNKLESECDEISFSNSLTQHEPPELPPPESLTSLRDATRTLSTKPESSLQPDKPSCRPIIAAGSFDKAEQSNKTDARSKFQSIGDLINQVLLDPGIMASANRGAGVSLGEHPPGTKFTKLAIADW
jgi:predicted transcriptional regulator